MKRELACVCAGALCVLAGCAPRSAKLMTPAPNELPNLEQRDEGYIQASVGVEGSFTQSRFRLVPPLPDPGPTPEEKKKLGIIEPDLEQIFVLAPPVRSRELRVYPYPGGDVSGVGAMGGIAVGLTVPKETVGTGGPIAEITGEYPVVKEISSGTGPRLTGPGIGPKTTVDVGYGPASRVSGHEIRRSRR